MQAAGSPTSAVAAWRAAKRREADTLKAQLEADMSAAVPSMNATIEALGAIGRAELQELKSLAKPPALVKLTLEAVCILFGREASWASAQRLLGGASLIKEIMVFDKDNVPPSRLRKPSGRLSPARGNVESLHWVWYLR